MATQIDWYLAMFILTTLIILVECIVMFQQTLTTKRRDITRLLRVLPVFCFGIVDLGLNILAWLSSMYPHYIVCFSIDLLSFRKVYEAFGTMFGFELYRQFELWLIDKMYSGVNMNRPEWFDQYFCCRQIFVILTIIFCYTFSLIEFLNFEWIFAFYMIFGLIVVVESLICIYFVSKFFKMLSLATDKSYGAKDEIEHAKFWMKFAIYLAFGIFLVGLAMFILSGQCCLNVVQNLQIDVTFIKNVFQSGLIIVVVGTLLTWIYQKNTCCTVMDGSICDVYCFGECYAFHCTKCCRTDIEFEDPDEQFMPPFREVSKDTLSNKRRSLLLNDSTATRQRSSIMSKYRRRKKKSITSFHPESQEPQTVISSLPEFVDVEKRQMTSAETIMSTTEKTEQEIEEERGKKVIDVLSMF